MLARIAAGLPRCLGKPQLPLSARLENGDMRLILRAPFPNAWPGRGLRLTVSSTAQETLLVILNTAKLTHCNTKEEKGDSVTPCWM